MTYPKNRMPRKSVWRSFKEAREFVHSLELKSSNRWKEYAKSKNKPKDIPANPPGVYKNKGWLTWGDFLGTGYVARRDRKYRSYEEAIAFARSLKLESRKEWKKYVESGKKPDDIPAGPTVVYKNKGWLTWGDWLGTETIASFDREFRSFSEARKFVHSIKIRRRMDWLEYARSDKMPDDIPIEAEHVYRKHGTWTSWGDFLGTGYVAYKDRKYRSYEEAKKFVQSLGLKSYTEWAAYRKSGKRPDDIIGMPERFYKEWKGWGDFLGTGNVSKKTFRPFKEAREFVHSLELKSSNRWKEYASSGKRPDDIPSTPYSIYKNKGWTNWGDFLGYSNIIAPKIKAENYLPWPEAKIVYRKFGKKYGCQNKKDWTRFARTHKKLLDDLRVPANPWQTYTKERVWRKMKK